jgi:hypothetical protein
MPTVGLRTGIISSDAILWVDVLQRLACGAFVDTLVVNLDKA